MSIVFYPAALSPYPSDHLVAARRVDPRDYPERDGVCIKLGGLGLSINWRRGGWFA